MDNSTNKIVCPSCGSGSYEQFSRSQFRCMNCKTVFDDTAFKMEPVEYELDLDSDLLNLKETKLTEPVPVNKRVINYLVDSLSIALIIVFFQSFGIEILGNVFQIYLLFYTYFFFMEAAFGQTIGKFVTRTKVVDLNGEKPTLGRIALRSICRFIPFDPISFLFQDRVFWHDSLSKTRVVDAA